MDNYAIHPGQIMPWSDTPDGRAWIAGYAPTGLRPYPAACTVWDAHDQYDPSLIYSVPFRLMWIYEIWTVHECDVREGDSLWHVGTFYGPTLHEDEAVFRYIEQHGIYVTEGHSFPQIIGREEWQAWLS